MTENTVSEDVIRDVEKLLISYYETKAIANWEFYWRNGAIEALEKLLDMWRK